MAVVGEDLLLVGEAENLNSTSSAVMREVVEKTVKLLSVRLSNNVGSMSSSQRLLAAVLERAMLAFRSEE